ncbi:MAG: MipA/OmpV family protein [Hydrogenophaga sp.]|nr:MipA/OmpV family protein [Hydrogenophaga sp.]
MRADQDTVGLRALKTDRVELDLGVAGSFGGGGEEIEARRGMSELGTLVELGPRLKLNLGEPVGRGRFRAEIPLRGVFDLNDRGRYRGVAFEPKLLYEGLGPAGWRYSTSLSTILADRRLSDYFYSVGPADATPLRPVYAARAGVVATRVSLSATRALGPDWRFFGFVRLDTVQGAANQDSPLVRQRSGASVGLGLSYTWKQSEARAHD